MSRRMSTMARMLRVFHILFIATLFVFVLHHKNVQSETVGEKVRRRFLGEKAATSTAEGGSSSSLSEHVLHEEKDTAERSREEETGRRLSAKPEEKNSKATDDKTENIIDIPFVSAELDRNDVFRKRLRVGLVEGFGQAVGGSLVKFPLLDFYDHFLRPTAINAYMRIKGAIQDLTTFRKLKTDFNLWLDEFIEYVCADKNDSVNKMHKMIGSHFRHCCREACSDMSRRPEEHKVEALENTLNKFLVVLEEKFKQESHLIEKTKKLLEDRQFHFWEGLVSIVPEITLNEYKKYNTNDDDDDSNEGEIDNEYNSHNTNDVANGKVLSHSGSVNTQQSGTNRI